MRNVDRLEEPKVLRRYAPQWTEELVLAIAEAEQTNGKVPPKLWRRYNRKEVIERLKEMFSGLCCYCESRVGDVAFEHVEHRKPKAHFPELTFAWANLHLACPKCNHAKSDKWDSSCEILDATSDHPISSHLGYGIVGTQVVRDPITDRGAITILHADLNRIEILESRQEVFFHAWETVCSIRDTERDEGESRRVSAAKSNFRKLYSGEHGSVYEFVARQVLNTI